jgi:hypothetical protein
MRRILQTTGFGIAVAGAFFGYAFAAPLEDGDISIDAATRRRCKNGFRSQRREMLLPR